MTEGEFQKLVLQELAGIKNKVNGIETRLGSIEARQDEIYRVVRAIEYSNQVGKSEIDNQGTRLPRLKEN